MAPYTLESILEASMDLCPSEENRGTERFWADKQGLRPRIPEAEWRADKNENFAETVVCRIS